MDNLQSGNGEAMPIASTDFEKKNEATNEVIAPYVIRAEIVGVAPLLFHAWDCADVEDKGRAAKGSKRKKTDNLESYVYRCPDKTLGVPGANIKACLVNAARWSQDPRSPRKSAMDLMKAGVLVQPLMISFGQKDWDYEDRRRVTIQRNGITRVRPALHEGWKLKFEIKVIASEYLYHQLMREVVNRAGELVGLCDFRPDFGRFSVVNWKISDA